ncbi:MAG: TetR family transcriptional regulator [Thermodesulfobacteriota bacterium]|nr:TetR family transcriptional regulator [Thermodesulfobacteriota bacterium]
MIKKRAISEADKQKRKAKILNTAWRLFRQKGGQLPTVSRIACKAGLSKGTVYLYFNTKEEIFLELYLQKVTEWFESGIRSLEPERRHLKPESMARLFTDYVVKNPDVMMMGSIAKAVLEDNIHDDALIRAKIASARLLEAAGELFAAHLPGITKEKGAEMTLWIISLMTGFWQFTVHPPHISRLIQQQNITVLEPDFEASVTAAVAALIRGCTGEK